MISARLLNASATRDDLTGEVNSRASTADVRLGLLTPNAPISATIFEATCRATQDGNTGGTRLVGLQSGPLTDPIGASPSPNTVINVPGIASVTINEQISNGDGSLTVNAIHIRLLGSIGTGDVIISSATCGPPGLPTPLASGAGLWLSLGLLGFAVVPAGLFVARRRRGIVPAAG